MIVAERKPFEEIYGMLEGVERLLVLGCGTCVTVCMAGGEKEVKLLSSTVRMADRERGIARDIREGVVERQCDREFFDDAAADIAWADAVLSMACGVGVQFLAEVFPDAVVFPALNTRFYGANIDVGVWEERCAGCGDCVLHKFGGVCPVARCSKSLMNGPCGGSQDGRCEVDPENIPCAWQLIYDRLKRIGGLERLEAIEPLKDWSTTGFGGPGRLVRKDMTL